MEVYIILKNKNKALRKFKTYDYYQTKGNSKEQKKEFVHLIFGSLIIFTVCASFIALLIVMFLS